MKIGQLISVDKTQLVYIFSNRINDLIQFIVAYRSFLPQYELLKIFGS